MVRSDEDSEQGPAAREARQESRDQTTSSVSEVAVVTAAHGRHPGLEVLHDSLTHGTVRPRVLVAVALEDEDVVEWAPDEGAPVAVVPLSLTDLGAPWAAAKNVGATTAFDTGATVVVLVRAGVEVRPDTLEVLERAARERDGVWWVAPDGVEVDDASGVPEELDPTALAFSLTTWGRLHGYDGDYVGAGWEDYDLVLRARREGLPVGPVPGARLGSRPPLRDDDDRPPGDHDAARRRNADLFEQRWGRRPPADVVGGW